jgi:glutaredoxin
VNSAVADPGTDREPVVTFLTRAGCHLCETGWAEVLRARERRAFSLERIDVESDPELRAEYGEQVPVVLIDGRLFCYFEVKSTQLLAALQVSDVR